MLINHLSAFERHLKVLQALSDRTVKVYSRKIEEFCTWMALRTPHPAVVPASLSPCVSNSPAPENARLPSSTIPSAGIQLPAPIIPSAITRQDIEAYLEYCFYRGNSNHTRATKLVALRKYFRFLVYEGVMSADPTERIPPPKIRRTFVQRFTKEEVLRLFATVLGRAPTIPALHHPPALDPGPILTEKGLRDIVILILAAFCGLRIGEIITLTLQDAIEEGKSITFRIHGKGDKPREVYLWKIASEPVHAWYSIRVSQGARPADPLIISYGRGSHARLRRLTTSSLDDMLKRLAAAAQIRKPKVSMHMFRAAHAHDLRHIQGYDTPAIAERLGHASIATTDRYIPTRGRIHRTYPSLAAYWREFTILWERRNEPGATTNPPALSNTYDDHGGTDNDQV